LTTFLNKLDLEDSSNPFETLEVWNAKGLEGSVFLLFTRVPSLF
jgi:hypothetical protein